MHQFAVIPSFSAHSQKRAWHQFAIQSTLVKVLVQILCPDIELVYTYRQKI